MRTNADFVAFVKSKVDCPYWYGTFGHTASEELYKSQKQRFPAYYSATDFPLQYGKQVFDCVGLVKSFVWDYHNGNTNGYNKDMPDVDANTLAIKCGAQPIATLPRDLIGVCVFMRDHVGVYVGDGRVVEARGHAYGVVNTALDERPWLSWGKLPYISYEPVKAWYIEAMSWAAENGIMTDGRPNDTATRAEIAQMFFNLFKQGGVKN